MKKDKRKKSNKENKRKREGEAAVTLWLLLNEGVVCNAMCSLGLLSPDKDAQQHTHAMCRAASQASQLLIDMKVFCICDIFLVCAHVCVCRRQRGRERGMADVTAGQVFLRVGCFSFGLRSLMNEAQWATE